VKPAHLDDCAVQLHVLQGCGLRIDSAQLVHVNTAYLREGHEIDWAAFFARSDLTREVAAVLPGVRERVAAFHAVVRAPSAPEIEPSGHCFAPFDCEFWDYCTRGKPEDWIFHLPWIGKRFETLRAAGVERIAELPDEPPLPALHDRIRSALRSGRAQLAPGLGEALRAAGPPAHYLDFETTSPAIPLYPGTRPYEVIPFQWSLHSDDGSARLRHRELLADGAVDPRREFAETLLAALGGDDAPVIVYSPFESRQLGQLEERFPDLAPRLRGIRERLFDLLPVVRRHLYHPGFAFSFSIKAVAPALAPGLDWSDLGEIAEGASASAAFASLAAGRVPAAEQERLRTALRRYCARDTLALARVHAALREAARGS
jgi:predicted RecB family nuclease